MLRKMYWLRRIGEVFGRGLGSGFRLLERALGSGFRLLSQFGEWAVKSWRSTQPTSEIKRDVERIQLLTQKKIAKVDYKKTPELRAAELDATIEGFRSKIGTPKRGTAEMLKEVDLWEAEAKIGVENPKTLREITKVADAKRR